MCSEHLKIFIFFSSFFALLKRQMEIETRTHTLAHTYANTHTHGFTMCEVGNKILCGLCHYKEKLKRGKIVIVGKRNHYTIKHNFENLFNWTSLFNFISSEFFVVGFWVLGHT